MVSQSLFTPEKIFRLEETYCPEVQQKIWQHNTSSIIRLLFSNIEDSENKMNLLHSDTTKAMEQLDVNNQNRKYLMGIVESFHKSQPVSETSGFPRVPRIKLDDPSIVNALPTNTPTYEIDGHDLLINQQIPDRGFNPK